MVINLLRGDYCMKYDLVKKISGLRENVASMFIDKKHTFWYILCFSVSLYVYFFLRSNLGGDLLITIIVYMIVEYIKVKKPEVSTKMKLPQLNRVLNVFSLFLTMAVVFLLLWITTLWLATKSSSFNLLVRTPFSSTAPAIYLLCFLFVWTLGADLIESFVSINLVSDELTPAELLVKNFFVLVIKVLMSCLPLSLLTMGTDVIARVYSISTPLVDSLTLVIEIYLVAQTKGKLNKISNQFKATRKRR